MIIRPLQTIVLALSLTLSQQASASLILNITNGILTGAQGVNVNGLLYDVTFQDGTCDSLFNNCNSFTFTDLATANMASQALLDTVFIDTASGLFDSNVTLTTGCAYPVICNVFTPYASSTDRVSVSYASNASSNIDGIFSTTLSRQTNTTIDDAGVYAVWKPASTAVPEPASLPLVVAGLFGTLILQKRRRQQLGPGC
jgi:hypothetical protein